MNLVFTAVGGAFGWGVGSLVAAGASKLWSRLKGQPAPKGFSVIIVACILSWAKVGSTFPSDFADAYLPFNASQALEPPPIADDPKLSEVVSIAPYMVYGADADSIRRSLVQQRPTKPSENLPYDAYTEWRINWRWQGDGQGNCLLSTTRTSFSAIIHLPQLDPAGVPHPVLTEWKRYTKALLTHEMMHVRNAYDHVGQVGAAVRGATCDTANSHGNDVLNSIREQDRKIDRDTQHGALQGAVFGG